MTQDDLATLMGGDGSLAPGGAFQGIADVQAAPQQMVRSMHFFPLLHDIRLRSI